MKKEIDKRVNLEERLIEYTKKQLYKKVESSSFAELLDQVDEEDNDDKEEWI